MPSSATTSGRPSPRTTQYRARSSNSPSA
ncbi:hypothetical protein CGRA01v4_04535 [Colletotrichum graminicola]|nr:hypothetical protein CGRA01v4_04535 [Colletotrichum graminicola]